LSPAPSPDASPAPLLCLYGALLDSAAIFDLPEGVETLTFAGDDAAAALRHAAAGVAGRDVVLLARSTMLPPHWWPRLVGAAQAVTAIDVFSPMLEIADVDAGGFANIDACCWAVSDRQVVACGTWSTALSYWRASAIDRIADDSATGELPASCVGGLLDHLCVGVPVASAETDVSTALKNRLNLVVDQQLPHYGLDGKPVVLHVLHGWGGGAQRFVEDLSRADDQRHHLVLVARSNSTTRQHGESPQLFADVSKAPLRAWPLAAPIAATSLHSPEYAAHLATVLHDFGVGAVMVSSLIGHSLDALRTGLPTAVVTHDYYPVWPRLHADFGDTGVDFSPDAIGTALKQAGRNFEFEDARASTWRDLRAAYVEALTAARATMISPSASVESNLQRIEPALRELRWRRIEHGFAGWTTPPSEIPTDPARKALRIVVPGRINGGKGEALIAAALPQLPDNVELILLGAGAAAMRFFGSRNVHVMLDYRRDELPARLAELKPDAALLASTVAETYSYLLSELWSLGVPVLATRLGSFAERIDDGRNGFLFEPTAAALIELLTRLRDDRAPLIALRNISRPTLRNVAEMARDYREAVPSVPAALPRPSLLTDARQLHFEVAATTTAVALDAAEAKLAAQQIELERRAEWAHTHEKLAAERTRWATRMEAEAKVHIERGIELDREVQARGAWAQSLIVEAERLKELIASEQRRLEAELERERTTLTHERDKLATQIDQMLNSSSWRLTRPLRFARRVIGTAPVRIGFQVRRARGIFHRVWRSLKTRGMRGTLLRAKEEFRPAQPDIDFVLPAAGDDTLPKLPLAATPRASIIVPVYNHFHHTRTCLQALAACGDATPFEVIVVDDGSSDETAARLTDLEGLRFVRNPQNLGFIGACNAGAAQARGEFLVFLNNDTAVQAGWLDTLLATFDQHERVGLAGSKLVYPDGRLQEAGGIVFFDASGWNYGRFDDPADPRYNYVREVDYCSGAAIAIRKELFDGFGGFDSLYAPAYYEDTDLAMKVRSAGLRAMYQPASVVVHFEGVTSGTDTAGSGTKRFQVINQAKFLERWREVLATHPAPGTDIPIAREHRAGKRVLMIDATTPQPDHDSGSLRLVNCMRVLRSEGHAVTFFADNRAWIERYTADLQQLGVEVLWHPWLADPVRWFAENGRRFDLVFISRHYIASSYVGLVRLHAPQARLVFDTVDLHYLREQREAELSNREDLAHAADVTRTKELALIRSCDVTLVVSPVEQELLRHEAPGARVEVLSNVHEVFGRRREFAQRRDLMFMGGFQHPPNTDAALWFVRDIFPLVRAELPDVKFNLIGSKANETVRALGEIEGVIFHGYVPDIEPFLDGCRLAVAPLRYGAGVKGKVNMSMSYGQPVVATPIAVEGMYAEPGRDVLVASDAAQIAAQIVRAYNDEVLWTSLSDNGLENVRRHFSFDAARSAVRRLFQP
jgi:GT2 family glycosyltransferase/glycosyltransferase involved in cell wall biosynthesis